MSWEIYFVILLLLFALINFVWEKLSTDLTAYCVFAALTLVTLVTQTDKLPGMPELLQVFASPAPITIAAMFVMSHALERCGAIESLANTLGRLASLGYGRFLVLMILTVALCSAFVNNTPVVVILMPVVLSLSRQLGVPASKLLIPLSYASIFGGICTAIGTSTNILVSGVLTADQREPLSMFELSQVGLPILFLGTLYLYFFGRHLLPQRETLTSILSEEERKEYITEAFVQPGSALAGKTMRESGLSQKNGVRPLEVIRNGIAVDQPMDEITLEPSDRLVMACRPSGIMKARKLEGIDFLGDRGLDLEQITSHEGAIVEGVIGPRSTIVGKTISEINFRQRYRMVILALHRQGRNLREKLNTVPLEFGDTLLMMGSNEAIEKLQRSDDVILLDRPHLPARDMGSKMPLVLTTLVGMVLAISFLGVPIVGTIIVAVAIMLLARVIDLKEAYGSIEWRILMLIFGMLALGTAMEQSGLTQVLANTLINASESVSPEWRPYLMLILIYAATSILTEMLSNNATAVLMAPIAIELGMKLGLDPRPFVIATCVASSASFATPVGYQTNTYVYGAGGYKFRDFLKVGIPLNVLYGVSSVLLIPLFWPFQS